MATTPRRCHVVPYTTDHIVMPARANGSISVAAKNASASNSSRSESGHGRRGAFKRCAGLVTALMARHCASRSSAKKSSGSCQRRMTSTLLLVVIDAVRALGGCVLCPLVCFLPSRPFSAFL